jgi:hypothetical protein
MRSHIPICLALAAISPAFAQTKPTHAAFAAASVRALPNAHCLLHPEESTDEKASIPVVADYDGYARFYAPRAGTSDKVQALSLDCVDGGGKSQTFRADLTADATFAARPVDLSQAPGVDRPALTDDPSTLSQQEMLQRGYGLRPEGGPDTTSYRQWLAAAKKHARMLKAWSTPAPSSDSKFTRRLPSAGINTTTAPNWTGMGMNGAPPYNSITAQFNVPTALPQADGTGTTGISIWDGVTGSVGSTLIQTGTFVNTSPSGASYLVFREYCCGDGVSNNYSGAFNPAPGDEIFVQSWFCDKQGNPSETVGYGCTFLHDLKSNAILNCVKATDPTCPSVPPLSSFGGYGNEADFIIELEVQPAFTPFTPAVTMTGDAYSNSAKKNETIGTDPNENLYVDFTNSVTTIGVIPEPPNSVVWEVSVPAQKLPPGNSKNVFEDDNTQVAFNGKQVHICKGGVAMIGVDRSNNRFLCSNVLTPDSTNLIVDTSTQVNFAWGGATHSVHVCPHNSIMVGWSQDNNWLICTPVPPSGYVTLNGFGAVTTDGPGGTQVTEPNHPGTNILRPAEPGSAAGDERPGGGRQRAGLHEQPDYTAAAVREKMEGC